MTRGRRSGLTGFGGGCNEGGGGLRMGIRGKSRGGTEQDITLEIYGVTGKPYKICVNMNDSAEYGAYVKIPSGESESKELLIYHTTTMTNETIRKHISQTWKVDDDYTSQYKWVTTPPIDFRLPIRIKNILNITDNITFEAYDTDGTPVQLMIQGEQGESPSVNGKDKPSPNYFLKWYGVNMSPKPSKYVRHKKVRFNPMTQARKYEPHDIKSEEYDELYGDASEKNDETKYVNLNTHRPFKWENVYTTEYPPKKLTGVSYTNEYLRTLPEDIDSRIPTKTFGGHPIS